MELDELYGASAFDPTSQNHYAAFLQQYCMVYGITIFSQQINDLF